MITLARWTTLIGYAALISTILVWHLWISPPTQLPNVLLLALLLTPLMLPLQGLLRAKPYTHAWSSFLALFYFLWGMSSIAVEAERAYGVALTSASLVFFNGCIFYVRFRGKQIRTQPTSPS